MTSYSTNRTAVDSFLREHPRGCSLAARIQPNAKRTAITGVYSAENRPHLVIAIQAPPLEDKANEALLKFLSRIFSIPRSRIEILHGERDRMKLLLLEGLSHSKAQMDLIASGVALHHFAGTE